MGWCSGTSIFDAVAHVVLDTDLPKHKQYEIMSALTYAMYESDWDCESDSQYYDHPIVQDILHTLNPD